MNQEHEIVLYQVEDTNIYVNVFFKEDTFWMTQKAMAELFDCTTDNISLHLKNIYKEEELDEVSTTEFFSVVQNEGQRNVKRNVKCYNLDAIIAVGYRVNSKKATRFRQWATKTLKEYITKEMALMALAVYIFLDLKYDRNRIDSYHEEIRKSTTHMVPFLRQYYITCQFAGIWKSIINLSEEYVQEFNQEVMWYLDAYERAIYGKSLLESPFFIGETSIEISRAQSCWNDIYETLIPYVSPSVGIGKVFVYNVLTKKFE